MIDLTANHWKVVPHPEAAAAMKPKQLRLINEFLIWVEKKGGEVTVDHVLQEWDQTISTSRMDVLLRGFRKLFGDDHTLSRTMAHARKLRRREYLARHARKTDVSAPHWSNIPYPEAIATLSTKRLKKVDDFLAWMASRSCPVTVDDLLQDWDTSKSEGPLKLLYQSMAPLCGDDHPLCLTIYEASRIRCSAHRKSSVNPGDKMDSGNGRMI